MLRTKLSVGFAEECLPFLGFTQREKGIIVVAASMKCRDCGTAVEKEAQFCPKCFAHIEPPTLWQRFLGLLKGDNKPRKPFITIKKAVSICSTDAKGQHHEYHSLDDVPPELRKEVEKLQSEELKATLNSSSLDGLTTITSRKTTTLFRVKDASGNERTYHALDELPPEIRAAFERAQDKKKG